MQLVGVGRLRGGLEIDIVEVAEEHAGRGLRRRRPSGGERRLVEVGHPRPQVVDDDRAVGVGEALLERPRRPELGVHLEDEVAAEGGLVVAPARGEVEGLAKGAEDALADVGRQGRVAGVLHRAVNVGEGDGSQRP